jgi:hypothetical protein
VATISGPDASGRFFRIGIKMVRAEGEKVLDVFSTLNPAVHTDSSEYVYRQRLVEEALAGIGSSWLTSGICKVSCLSKL